jgi:hypothetical protein
MKRQSAILAAVAVAFVAISCAGVKTPKLPAAAPPANTSIWIDPADLAERDLFYGPYGAESAPDPSATYTLVNLKHTGVNLGMTVKDPRGREWSVKQPYPGALDSEAPVEVALSRILSAIGYHQPPVYFLPAFTLKDDFGSRVVTGGRFRLKDETLNDQGMWNWADNPFVGTKPYQGLIVLLMMFNSTDLKASNNTLYEHRVSPTEHWYAVRDIGAALGDVNRISPRKNHPDSFETFPFITGTSNGYVVFAYDGWYKNLVRDRITVDEVKWASELLGRLSDKQWNDAFRAGGYEPDTASRFINALKKKIDQGKSLTAPAAR